MDQMRVCSGDLKDYIAPLDYECTKIAQNRNMADTRIWIITDTAYFLYIYTYIGWKSANETRRIGAVISTHTTHSAINFIIHSHSKTLASSNHISHICVEECITKWSPSPLRQTHVTATYCPIDLIDFDIALMNEGANRWTKPLATQK